MPVTKQDGADQNAVEQNDIAKPAAAKRQTFSLFQEPVIPDLDDFEVQREGRRGRNEDEQRPSRRRRLNAEERRAADEVEQIEEDLEDERIDYRPISIDYDDDAADFIDIDDRDDAPRTQQPSKRTSRSRSGRSNRSERDNRNARSDAREESSRHGRRDEHDERDDRDEREEDRDGRSGRRSRTTERGGRVDRSNRRDRNGSRTRRNSRSRDFDDDREDFFDPDAIEAVEDIDIDIDSDNDARGKRGHGHSRIVRIDDDSDFDDPFSDDDEFIDINERTEGTGRDSSNRRRAAEREPKRGRGAQSARLSRRDEDERDEEPASETRRRVRKHAERSEDVDRFSREAKPERDDRDNGDDEQDERSSSRSRVRSRSQRDRDRESEEDDQPLTRRRRRRRTERDERDEREPRTREGVQGSSTRSRKQQYIDEITDIEGSTRLAAKKQRRKDNRRERNRQSQIMEQDFLARRENVERLMVVREKGQHTQISVIEDNVLVEHYVSDIQEVSTVGNIYLGRVQNVLPSMEAAFVDIGQARNGVLYAGEVNWDSTRLEGQPRRIELAFKSGDPVLVQVTKDPIGHKGPRLTSQITLAGRFLVLVPSGGMTGVSRKLPEKERTRLKSIVSRIGPKGMGVIIRTAAEGASEEALEHDLQTLERQWEQIEQRREEFRHGKRAKLLQGEPDVAIRVVRDIFNDDFSKMIVEGDEVYSRIEEYLNTMAPDLEDRLERWDPEEHEGKDVFDKWQIDSQLRKGMERQVYLPSGGSIVIDRTEAMTTIDVNTGRFIGKGKSLEETVTRCNLEASEEIARQLRLRDIGGMIMIDYVDMVMPANRDLVLRRLMECLARDHTKHQVAEVTSLGLVQMTRKRVGQGLVEAFSEECPTCKGRGFILHDEPTVSADYADPYALKGGDPFVKTNKHGHGAPEVQAPQGSSASVKAKLAQIAAAAVAAGDDESESDDVAVGASASGFEESEED